MNTITGFCVLVISLALLQRGLGGEKEDFEEILKEASRPWGLDSKQESKWLGWSGLKTLTGFQIAAENLLESDERSRRELSRFVFSNTRVPKDDLVAYLKATIDQSAGSGDMKRLERSFELFHDLEGDARVVAHFAKYFADDRIIETKARQRESYLGEPLRVSDWACAWAKAWIQKNGMWDPADPDCHEDPGGYMMWEGRDNTKEALNRFLLKKGLIEKAEQPSRRKWDHDYSTAATPAKVEPARPRKDPQPPPATVVEEKSGHFPWPWIAAALVLLFWIAIRFLKTGATR